MRQKRNDADEDKGRWITTENNHKIHLNEEDVPDKGNPHVISAMNGSRDKTKLSVQAVTKTVKSATTRTGKKIDLSGTPLKYTAKANLNPNCADIVHVFEGRRKDNKVEYAKMFDASGRSLGEYKGGKSSARIPTALLMKAEVLTHIHPRADNEAALGGPFSEADLRAFTTPGGVMRTMRAAAQEGVYTIQKGPNFDGPKFMREASKRYQDILKKHKTVYDDMNAKLRYFGKQYKSGALTYEEYGRKYDEVAAIVDEELNKELIEQHNALLDMQKDFDFEYGLEEW